MKSFIRDMCLASIAVLSYIIMSGLLNQSPCGK